MNILSDFRFASEQLVLAALGLIMLGNIRSSYAQTEGIKDTVKTEQTTDKFTEIFNNPEITAMPSGIARTRAVREA